MTYLPPGNQDPYGQQPQSPQDPFSGQQSNPYAQQPPPPQPSSVPPAAPYGQPYGYAAAPPPQNSMALTAMILALVGLAVPITAPVGAILGHIAMKQIKQTGESGDGMAKTGIIAGWSITGLWGLCCIGYIIFIVFIATSASTLN
ncbi:MAG TPA: DUF4190 domain-containing protein [Candidatus Limnocylindrales bacterium]